MDGCTGALSRPCTEYSYPLGSIELDVRETVSKQWDNTTGCPRACLRCSGEPAVVYPYKSTKYGRRRVGGIGTGAGEFCENQRLG